MKTEALHQRALTVVKSYRAAEGALVSILQEIDRDHRYRELGYPSLFVYATGGLGMIDAEAYRFITVARKSVEIPLLKDAIDQGSLNVSKASRIASVIVPANQEQWLEAATTLPYRELEKAVAAAHPDVEVRERVRPISGDRSELRCGLSSTLEAKIQRARDVLSQKRRGNCSLEDVIDVAISLFLEKQDPVRKATRATESKFPSRPINLASRNSDGSRRALPAAVAHQVVLRDRGRCTYVGLTGVRCCSERWIEKHHIQQVAKGGNHSDRNLATLCFAHHQLIHEKTG